MSIESLSRAARVAGQQLVQRSGAERSALLTALAAALQRPERRAAILEANAQDVARAQASQARGELGAALVKRLVLDEAKLQGLCEGLQQLAAQEDRVGRVQVHRELDTGLVLQRVSCPLGVLGVVFESRPDALIQIVGLALRSANAVLLKGGREALGTNRALTACVHEVLEASGVDTAAAALLEDRAAVDELLSLERGVDLVIARGGSEFVRHVRARARMPVLAHADGLCHLYLHGPVDAAMAAALAVDAKCSYPAACNSIETLLWEPGASGALDACVAALQGAGVELRADEATRARHPSLAPATEADWDTEYSALVLSIACVSGLDEALAHIARHGSRHTEAIVTVDSRAAERFLGEVDAGSVFHNASTRFADGYRYGLGAEVGISTEKLHARGPVGVEGLLTYRWLLRGEGQVASAYGPQGRRFTHRDLP